MSPDGTPVPPETLLAHTGWMRRLARTLVRDDAQADDVVQDAVVAAMRSPPRDPVALPAWLAIAVKNGARQLWRGESRRSAREHIAARPEAAPGAAEVVARAEEHALVVQAVLALEEPYRSALLLRFYDDLPPRDVAARLGVPVETARARIRRGIDQLRGRLDQRHGGDGHAWKLALVPLTLHHGSAALGGSGAGAAAGHQLTTGAMVMAGTGSTAVVGGLALAIGVAAGWWFGAGKAETAEADREQAVAQSKKESETLGAQITERDEHLKRQTAQVADLESKLRAAQKQAADIQKELDEKTAALARAEAAVPQPAAAPAAPVAKGPRFAFGQYAKLGDVDWKAVGEHLNAISPLCGEISAAMQKGEDYTALQGKAAQHNGFLINAAVKIVGQVPGTGVNGAFTHPAFQANAIAAALEAAGKPLTPGEATAIEKLARELSDEDASRVQGYTDATYTVQKLLEEGDIRGRFYDGAFKALTEEQRDALTPPGTKGRLGLDLYSEGLLWLTVMRPLAFKEKDTDALVADVMNAFGSRLKLQREQQDAARAVVAKWANDLPASLVTMRTGADGGSEDTMTVPTVRLAATQTLVLLQRLVADLKLEGASAEAARKWPAALVPVAQKAD